MSSAIARLAPNRFRPRSDRNQDRDSLVDHFAELPTRSRRSVGVWQATASAARPRSRGWLAIAHELCEFGEILLALIGREVGFPGLRESLCKGNP